MFIIKCVREGEPCFIWANSSEWDCWCVSEIPYVFPNYEFAYKVYCDVINRKNSCLVNVEICPDK